MNWNHELQIFNFVEQIDEVVIGFLAIVFGFKIIFEKRLDILIQIDRAQFIFIRFQISDFRYQVYNPVMSLVNAFSFLGGEKCFAF